MLCRARHNREKCGQAYVKIPIVFITFHAVDGYEKRKQHKENADPLRIIGREPPPEIQGCVKEGNEKG